MTDLKHLDVVLFRGGTQVKQPVHVPSPDPAECDEWFAAELVAYAGRKLRLDSLASPPNPACDLHHRGM